MGLKDNGIANDVLVLPAVIVDEPPQKLETPAATEDAVARVGRVFVGDQAEFRRTDEWNAERRRKGPHIGQNWFYHEAAARLKSC